MHRHLRKSAILLVASISGPVLAAAQQPAAAPPPAPAPTYPFDFSGVIYTSLQSGGARGARAQNRFELDRAYLTFRAPAGDNVGIRVTADIYQQRDSTKDGFYRGWAFRAKYAYVQYDFLRGVGTELKANARLGMLHTPIIDYEEQFWPRGLSQVAIEQAGFQSSADMGAATTVTLPNHHGEVYAVVNNGAGYGSRETDRFKDYAGRVSITPLANGHSFFRTLTLSPWYSKGYAASAFAAQKGTVLPVSAGQQKDRYGFFAALKDPRITLGSQLAWRKDAIETADTTVATAPTVTTRTGSVLSLYTIAKPLTFVSAGPNWPLAVVLRWDRVRVDTGKDPYQTFVIAGLQYELSKKATVTLDYQDGEPKKGSTAADTRTLFVHVIANF
jgi:hypothetical protein